MRALADLAWPLQRIVTMCLTAASLKGMPRPCAVHWERLSHYSRCQAVLESVQDRRSPFCLLPPSGRIGTRCFPAAHAAYHCMVALTLFRHFGDSDSKCSGLPWIATSSQTLSPRLLCVASQLSRHPVCPSLSLGDPLSAITYTTH